jgi:hypothetical protein
MKLAEEKNKKSKYNLFSRFPNNFESVFDVGN